MIESKIEIIKLSASEGYTLTNGETFGKEVYLGRNDSPDNWREVTDEEAAALKCDVEESTVIPTAPTGVTAPAVTA